MRLITLLLFLGFCQSLFSQTTTTITIFDEIPLKPSKHSKDEIHHALIDSVKYRQKIISREFSMEPSSIYTKDNLTYATWDIDYNTKETKIIVTTTIEQLDFGLQTIHNTSIKDIDQSPKDKFLEKDKFLNISHKKMVATANSLQGQDELETIKNIFQFVSDHMEYEIFGNQERGAIKALKTGLGDSTEHAELFIALCRASNIPARYVTGLKIGENYLIGDHNWAEAYSSELGWIPVDATWLDFENKAATFEDVTNRIIYIDNKRDIRRTFLKDHSGSTFPLKTETKQRNPYDHAIALYNDFKLEEAIAAFDNLIQTRENHYQYFNFKGMALARLEKFDVALANLQLAIQLCPDEEKNLMIYSMSNFFALKGEKGKCLSYLEAAFEAGFTDKEFIKTDPDFDKFKDDVDFIKLLE